MAFVFSDSEIATVINRYPRLKRVDIDKIEGVLDINATYNGGIISDSFDICITASNPHSHRMPALYETGGRIESISKKWKISDPRDLHCNKTDGTICLCVKQVEEIKFPSGSNLLDFVEQLVVPYFYALSHYEKTKQWLWGEYSHGAAGLLEFYADNQLPQTTESITEALQSIRRDNNWRDHYKQLRNPSAKRSCICGGGKSFRKCHFKAWRGLNQLVKEISRLNVDIKPFFDY